MPDTTSTHISISRLKRLARDEAHRCQHPYIRSEHLLLAIARLAPGLVPVSYAAIAERVGTLNRPTCTADAQMAFAAVAERAVQAAAAQSSADTVQLAYVLQQLQQHSALCRRILDHLDVDEDT